MEVVNQFSRLSKVFLSLLVVVSMSMLVACGSSGSSSKSAPDVVVIDGVDGTGYYKGTAGIKESDNATDIVITDLQGLVDGKHFMIISVEESLLFEGHMVFTNETDFTSIASIFQNGIKVGQTTVNATITQESKITGTFTGTGTGNGSFELGYVFSNSNEANVARIVTDLAEDEAWDGDFERNYDNWSNWLQVIADGTIVHFDSIQGGLYGGCIWYGSIEAIEGTAIYRVVYNIETFGCQNTELNGTFYTGLATSKSDIHVDDTLVFIFSNSSNAGLADMVFTKI